MKQDNHL